jgi:hypothetical protein
MASENTGNNQDTPRVKQMVIGRVDFAKRQESPLLVYIEPAQLPFEALLAYDGYPSAS